MHRCTVVCAILGVGRSHCELKIAIERKAMLSLLKVSITADLATIMGFIHAETVDDPFPSSCVVYKRNCISSRDLADKAVHQRMGIERIPKSRET